MVGEGEEEAGVMGAGREREQKVRGEEGRAGRGGRKK